MSEQYFVNQPQSKSDPKTWRFELRSNSFQFTSDVGVFSKNEVDFGSRTLIEAFELPNVSGDVVDIGCGYGPIGLALAKAFPDRHFIMSDVNERALVLAKKNAAQNNIDNTTFYVSDRFQSIPNVGYAAVLTNPPIRAGKELVHQIFEDSYQNLVIGGQLWVVIQKKQGAPSAFRKMQQLFLSVETITKSKGYEIICATK